MIEITLTVAVSYVAYFTVCSSPTLGCFIDYVHMIIMPNFCSTISICAQVSCKIISPATCHKRASDGSAISFPDGKSVDYFYL